MFPTQHFSAGAVEGGACDPEVVLTRMRGPQGGPNVRMRLLALLVALLLAGPLTLLLLRALGRLVDAAV